MKLTYPGKSALITGGTSDLAICLSKIMISEALFPVLAYRNESGLEKIQNELKGHDGRYGSALLDFAQSGRIGTLFENEDIAPDFLVDIGHGDFESLVASADKEAVYKYFEENISFRAALLRAVSREMLKKKRGRCIFISSTSAGKSNPGQGFYAAAKLASEALYRNLGLELGAKGITTVNLRTSYIDAGRGRKYFSKNSERILGQLPVGRILKPVEVAQTIMFFLSDSASGFNATEINLDGGFSASK